MTCELEEPADPDPRARRRSRNLRSLPAAARAGVAQGRPGRPLARHRGGTSSATRRSAALVVNRLPRHAPPCVGPIKGAGAFGDRRKADAAGPWAVLTGGSFHLRGARQEGSRNLLLSDLGRRESASSSNKDKHDDHRGHRQRRRRSSRRVEQNPAPQIEQGDLRLRQKRSCRRRLAKLRRRRPVAVGVKVGARPTEGTSDERGARTASRTR